MKSKLLENYINKILLCVCVCVSVGKNHLILIALLLNFIQSSLLKLKKKNESTTVKHPLTP